ncbi:MAG: hypothetical protein JSR30_09430 [Proteobacteria bacterium]|nr:hypothetical protein [Pseudomonadota bacterium]
MSAAETLTFTRIASDVCGNPRYVVHFLTLNTREELDRTGDNWIPVSEKYAIACKRANTIGGRRYHTKRYGGGIVFQSYSIDETAAAISRVTGRQFVAVEG